MINSIHLQTLSDLNSLPLDLEMSSKMDAVRRICHAALFLRKEAGIRVRMPLSELVIYSKNSLSMLDFIDIIKDELNIKKVSFSLDFKTVASEKLIINLKKCGQKFGNKIPELVKAVNNGNWERSTDGVMVLGDFLPEDYYEIKLDMKIANAKVCSCGEIAVFLDIKITSELEKEGIARDIIRMIQQGRKDMQLNVSDRIEIGIKSNNDKINSVINNSDLVKYISNETLADKISNNCDNFDKIFEQENEEFGSIKIGIISK